MEEGKSSEPQKHRPFSLALDTLLPPLSHNDGRDAFGLSWQKGDESAAREELASPRHATMSGQPRLFTGPHFEVGREVDDARRRSSDLEQYPSVNLASLRASSEDTGGKPRVTETKSDMSPAEKYLWGMRRDREALGDFATPQSFNFARDMPRHELMSLAADALDALAVAEPDELDFDIEETGDIEDVSVSNQHRASNVTVDQALDDLAKLEEAFVHVEQRFHKRLSTGSMQNMTNQHMSMRLEKSEPRPGGASNKKRQLTMTMVWNHHREGGLFVFYEVCFFLRQGRTRPWTQGSLVRFVLSSNRFRKFGDSTKTTSTSTPLIGQISSLICLM
jgi:hypothetical protein